MPAVELRFAPLPAHARTARLVAAVLARRARVHESYVDEVKLAVGEACARAIGLHRDHAAEDDVVVSFGDDGGVFSVTVRDRGPHDAEVGASGADLPDLVGDLSNDPALGLPSGFGLAVVAGLVDDVEITAVEPGTEVRMSWPAATASAGGDGAAEPAGS